MRVPVCLDNFQWDFDVVSVGMLNVGIAGVFVNTTNMIVYADVWYVMMMHSCFYHCYKTLRLLFCLPNRQKVFLSMNPAFPDVDQLLAWYGNWGVLDSRVAYLSEISLLNIKIKRTDKFFGDETCLHRKRGLYEDV